MDLARSGIKLFAAKIGGTVISFLGILYFARELGAAVLGMFFLFEALSGILVISSNLGTRSAIEKRMSEGEVPDEILTTGILFKIPILIVIISSIFAFSDYINQYIGVQIAGLLALTVVIKESGHLMANVLKGELRVGESAVLKIVNKVVWIGVAFILVSLGYGVYGLVYGVIAGFSAKFLLGWYKISTSLGTPSMEHAYSIWDYAKYTIVPALDEYIHNWTDILVMGFFLTSAAVGAYEISWRILTPIFVLTTAVSATVFPQISAWDANNQTDRIEQLFPKALTPSLILVIPAFFGALLLSSEILSLLFGAEFAAAALALPILMIALIPRAIRSLAGRTLQGINKPQFVNRAAIVDIVTNIVLNIILIWQLGLVGAAIATMLSYTVGASLRWYYLDQYLTLHVPYREIGWCAISALGMSIAVFTVQEMMVIDTVVRLFATIGFGVLVYGCFVLLYEPLRSTIVQHTNRLIRTTA